MNVFWIASWEFIGENSKAQVQQRHWPWDIRWSSCGGRKVKELFEKKNEVFVSWISSWTLDSFSVTDFLVTQVDEPFKKHLQEKYDSVGNSTWVLSPLQGGLLERCQVWPQYLCLYKVLELKAFYFLTLCEFQTFTSSVLLLGLLFYAVTCTPPTQVISLDSAMHRYMPCAPAKLCFNR